MQEQRKRLGRPPKPEERRRNVRMKFNVEPGERQMIVQAAAALEANVSEYMRDCVLRQAAEDLAPLAEGRR